MVEVETFEIEEATTPTGTTPEIEAEAAGLIQKLGLKGQHSLTVKQEGGATRIPYPEMTAQERAVYGAIFPAHTVIEEYNAGIIPVRVLQVAAHAREMFGLLQVWHKEVRDPDPILVGYKGNQYSTQPHLLARWGDGLRQFSELVKEARATLAAQFRSQLAEASLKVAATSADDLADKAVSGRPVQIHFWVNA